MEKTKKNLKITSVVLLIMAGFSLLNILAELCFGEINNAAIPEGAPGNILLITKIILLAISSLLLWPQIYISIKGIKIAKNPNASKRHIFWATVLLVLSVIALISPVVDLLNQISVYQNIGAILSILIDVVLYFEYVKYAKAIAKAN